MRVALLSLILLASPGSLVVAQDNPVTNGSFELANEDGTRAPGWEFMGDLKVVATDTPDGARALCLRRAPGTSGEVGLNRQWELNSGRQDDMLSQRRGGLRFWYKAVAAEPPDALTVQVIPMDAKPQEVGRAGRTVWRVPAAHVGDGQWHRGAMAYDYSEAQDVKWVHVSARLYANSGELWLDGIEWVPEVGPVLQVAGLEFLESPGREGEEGTLSLTLANVGDRPTPAGLAQARLPQGLNTAAAEQPLEPIGPGARTTVEWVVSGERTVAGQQLQVSAAAGEQEAMASLTLQPEVTVTALRCERMVMRVGQSQQIGLVVRNDGHAIAPAPVCRLELPASLEVMATGEPVRLRPGEETVVQTWTVRARRPDSLARARAAVVGLEGEATTRLVVAQRLPQDCAVMAVGPVYASVHADCAVVGSERARLVICRDSGGYSLAGLQAREETRWATVAIVPRLGLIAAENAEVALGAVEAQASGGAGQAQLRLTGQADLAGCRWRLEWRFSAKAGSDLIGCEFRATPESATGITCLEGPMLYCAEGVGAPRDDAILPGLEWLVAGEESSNALDIKPEHPDRVRYVPHPHKVTVPAVGMRFGKTTVGLLWDVPSEQASYRTAGAASLAFASPNRFEGHNNHLMGLFLPGVDRGVPENSRRAAQPLALRAGQRLVLRQQFLAAANAPDSLVTLDRWYAEHGYPEPLPFPRGDLQAEIAFSLQGYFKDRALWNPEWNRWYSDLIVGFHPTDGPADELLWGARLLGGGAVAQQAEELAAEVLGGDKRSRELRLQRGPDPAATLGLARQVRGLIASQHADGTWRFSGDRAGEWPESGVNYDVLGPVGASEVGLSASRAQTVLSFALQTGDRAATAAGLKALDGLRQFRVPRAAQVWEVPVHTPDILASAQAVSAFLEGYRLTGDPACLRDAVYWARSGLPFVYVWHPEDQPAMQGASIPVFGATGYVLSWFGVAVQWNGLAYAQALEDLARYDTSFPWQRVADNLVRSAMYQQAIEGPRLAQWPDALNFIPGRPGLHGQTPPCFQPSSILRESFRALGQHVVEDRLAVRQGGEHLCVQARAALGDAQWRGDRLEATATFATGQPGVITILPVTRPSRVVLDGAVLPAVSDLYASDDAGWWWHEPTATVQVRVVRDGRHRLLLEGIAREEVEWAPPPRMSLDFRFADGLDGWHADHDLQALAVSEGALQTTVTGADPYMSRESLHVEGRAGDVLVLRMECSGGGGSVFWATEDGGGFAPSREITYGATGGPGVQEVRIAVGDHSLWAGRTITALRIDPPYRQIGDTVRIESIRLERSE
ncbi:MAG: hypothetical protein HPY69_10155 [Armatimonadetes bacterium]|nr:hypothetical protein [Armatimonadota bacterium]